MSDASAYREPPPAISVAPVLRTAAGVALTATAQITNTAPEPRVMALASLGVDAEWLPSPARSRPLMPGETIAVRLTFAPALGTVPARYPLALTVQAIDPASGNATSVAAIADLTLVIDAPGSIEVAIEPPEIAGRIRTQMTVVLSNTGSGTEQVRLDVQSPETAEVELSKELVEVRPGARVVIPGRVKIEPRLFGHRQRLTYTVSARGSGAPRRAEGAVTVRAFLGANLSKAFALVAIVTLWAALAVIFIPKLASTVQNSEQRSSDKVSGLQNSAVSGAESKAPGVPGESGSGGAGGGSSGSGSGGGASGAGASGGASGSGGAGSGGAGSGGSATPTTVQLNGTVAGTAADGAHVEMRPTSLVDEEAQTAHLVGLDSSSFGPIGKIPEGAVELTAARTSNRNPTRPAGRTAAMNRSIVTKTDGAWSFPAVRAPGYYLVTFGKAGYQTQRYVIDSSAAVATNPLTVTLLPGQGRLRGRITGPAGAVGAATITISDGTNTLTTSSNSKGDVGAWSVTGLSTPSSYLVTASKDGLSTESALVTLPAGGRAVQNLRLVAGAASLTGSVTGTDSLGNDIGLGGVQVTATDGTTSRTATTVTNGNLAGTYTLPDLPPGRYTVTASSAGFQPQTRQVLVRRGQGSARADFMLTSSTGSVTGLVTGDELDANGVATGRRVTLNAGVVLTSGTNSYKITSGANGFRINGISPGTYVVTAQYAGLDPAYQTITVTAGRTTAVPTFYLRAQVTTSNSMITGFVGDGANPSGTLCATAPEDCAITFVLRDSHGVVVPTTPSSITPPSSSGPTSYTLSGADGGLAPGLYRLTIGVTLVKGSTLNGYLPATVSVQVPLNATARAPQVNLFNASTISGTISSTFDPTSGGTFPDCIWAVPLGESLPTDCTAPPSSPCLATGQASRSISSIAADGSYAIPDLCPGTYTMLVIVTNPDFIAPSVVPPPLVSVRDGSTGRYDAQIFRKGRIRLTLTSPDPGTGSVPALSDTTLDPGSACGGVDLGGMTTGAGGVLLVSGLAAGTVTCTLNATVGGVAVSSTVPNVTVNLDGTTSVAATLTAPVDTFVGQITTSWTGSAQPLPFTQVSIAGVTGYTNGVANPPTQVTVFSDAQGCFAVSSDGSAPTGALPGGCAGDPGLSSFFTARLPLASPRASFHVERSGYRTLARATAKIDPTALVSLDLNPTPVSFSGRLTATPSPTSLSTSIEVTKFPLGAGRLTVQADAFGNISWLDDSLPAAQQIAPGTYTIQVTGPGLAPWNYTFTCAPGAGCVQNFALVPLGALALDGLPANSVVTLLASDGTMVGPRTVNGSTTFDNLLPTSQFQGTQPSYQVRVQAPGYAFRTASVGQCPSTGTFTIDPGATTECQISLVPDGSIIGTISGSSSYAGNAFTQPLNAATVTAQACDGAAADGAATCPLATAGNIGPFTATTDGNGGYKITGTNQMQGLDPGAWLVTAHLDGYGDVSSVVNVVRGLQDGPDITLPIARVPTYSVTVSDSSGQTITDGVEVQLLQGFTVVASASTASAAGTYDFANLFPGTYNIQATGNKILATTDQDVVISQSATTHTIFVTLGASTVSGTISGQQGKDPGTAPLDGARVQIGRGNATTFAVANGTDGKPMDTTTPSSGRGAGVFSLGNVPDSPAAGWTVQITRDGYLSQTIVGVNVNHVNAPTVLDETLTRVTHNVVLTVTTTADGDDVAAATPVKLVSTADPTWTLTPQAPVSAPNAPHGTVDSWTFLAVPFGNWQVSVTLPGGHFGVLSATGGSVGLACTAGTATSPVLCRSRSAAPLVVPGGGDPSTAVGISYGLDEYLAGMSVVAAPLDADPDVTPPAAVDLEVSDPASNTVYSNTTFAVSARAPATPTDTFWGATGTAYETGGSSPVDNWTLGSTTITAGARTVTVPLTEIGATVKVQVDAAPAPAGTLAKITLVSPGGGIIAPKSQKIAFDGTATFTDVPFAANWKAKGTATYTVPAAPGPPPVPAHDVTVTGSTTFTIDRTDPPTVTVTLA